MTTLTDILRTFVEILEKIPKNLTKPALALLGVLTVIDIANQVFQVEEMDWMKWLVKKVVRVGILTFIITKWDWLLSEIIKGFVWIGEKGLGSNINAMEYMRNPSQLINRAFEIGDVILDSTQFWSLRTWANLIIWIFLIGAFMYIACTIVLTFIEFYFLTSIAIIFIPFGTIQVGESYFTNTLKLVVSCAIKICVLTVLMLMIEPIVMGFVVTSSSGQGTFLQMLGSLLVLAFLMMKLPDLASSMLTGTPSLSSNSLLQFGKTAGSMAIGAVGGAIAGAAATKQGYSETMGGASKGMEAGGQLGGSIGGSVGALFGPTGAAIGQKAGAAVGSLAGAVSGGAYSAGKFGTQKAASLATGGKVGGGGSYSSIANKINQESKSENKSDTGDKKPTENKGSTSEATPATKADTGTSTGGGSNSGDTGTSMGGSSSSGDTGTSTGGSSGSGDTGTSTGGGSNSGDTGTSMGGSSSSGGIGTTGGTSSTGTDPGRATETSGGKTKLNGEEV